ncbi:hypothetical protein H257_10839 [Aphanomyces astaci]|uniref:RING-type domain-containing protein n=1 Tax=Aphanomyces astaci TaxID=112090 RepID=W4G4U9_APHAT|nr:hypothetical protein H257_10839 [Aphanomyces astaci]ETV74742.1 hypothetical protein H257_10839 [Aphanomyces astaci]|eukprot:XP_009835829.1 hypothetical protein H257_10839 [Aphanomyces astaci]
MDMSEEGADGVDFDYLVELIRSAVGPYVVDENGDPVTPLQLLPRPRTALGAHFNLGFEFEEGIDDSGDSCEEGEVAYRPDEGMEGQVHTWMPSGYTDIAHSRSQVQDDVVTSDVIPSTATLAQAPFFLRPLSPDCLSPQSRIERVLGPGASLEPRPPARRRHPFDSNNQASPPPRRTRVGHVPPASFNVHATIFSDESDDEDAQDDDMHNSTLSSVSSDLDTNDDTHHMMHASNGVRSLPHLVFPHLVALGFDAATTLSALQAHVHDLQTLQTNGHDDSVDDDDDDDDGNEKDVLAFVALVQSVVDGHVGRGNADNQTPPPPRPDVASMLRKLILQPIPPDTTFPWPVFDMAQYEFGTSRPGTSFGCVVVVVNLPRVAAAGRAFDAVRQLLLVHLFSMVSNPLQVILPLGPPNATTMKGHGFVEFQNRQQATVAARTLDGLQWCHDAPPIRSMLFREYHGSNATTSTSTTTSTTTCHAKEAVDDLTLHAMDLMSEDEDGRSGDNNLSLRNDQLEYLIHYVEQDRDAILMENEELKDKLEAYRQREHEQEEALHSLSGLRKRIQVNEHKYRDHLKHMRQSERAIECLKRRMSELTGNTQALHALSVSELRDLEDTLDTALYKARAVKEQKIVEQRQALDRQVEVQQELKLCVICMSAEKTILCLPCRHVCMCQPCSEHSEVTRCPICRLDIAEKMAIFA